VVQHVQPSPAPSGLEFGPFGPPKDHLPNPGRRFFDPNGEKILLIEPKIVTHLLRYRDAAADSDLHVPVV